MYAKQLIQYISMRDIVLGENSPFSVNQLLSDISSIEKDTDISSFIKGYDLTKLLSPHTLNQTSPCHFFKGNMAWISVANGHYRYFSRNYNTKVRSFDTLDFLSAYFETTNKVEIVSKLLHRTPVISLDGAWRRKQEQRYLFNIEWAEALDKKDFLVKKTLSPHIELYKLLNVEGVRHLGPMFLSVEREDVFFASLRYLAKKLDISSAKVSKMIAYLEDLGLLERVKDEDLPLSFLERSEEIAGRKYHRINYYRMVDLREGESEVLGKCVEYALNGIRYTSKR